MEQPRTVTIAAAQYKIEHVGSWENYAAKAAQWVDAAAGRGGQILVFPEYASLELASLFSKAVCSSLDRQLEAIQDCLEDYKALYSRLAEQHAVYILAGSFPVRLADGTYRNRAFLFSPHRAFDHQEKLTMTPFEREEWQIDAGDRIKIFATDHGYTGINICYDSEFALFSRKQVEAGAKIIFVPSCTGSLAGYNRVRISCQARAVENQCFVVQSPTVGRADWSAALGETVGAAGIYTPIDSGFPEDGILAAGTLNRAQWVFAQVVPAALDAVRRLGEVSNLEDHAHERAHLSSLVAMATL